MNTKMHATILALLFIAHPVIADQKTKNISRHKTQKKKIEPKKKVDETFKVYEDVVAPNLAEQIENATKQSSLNIDTKRKDTEKFVKKAAQFLKNNPMYKAFQEFTHGKEFKEGELYIFAFSMDGICVAHGTDEDTLWQNQYKIKDEYGTLFIQNMIKIAKEQDSGWLTYSWRNAAKETYVMKVTKDNEDFLIGAGFYPHSKQAAVVNLVSGAVALFNYTIKKGQLLDRAFSLLSYPMGRFVLGDLYLYAISFDGKTMAHGDRPGLIGTNAIEYRDASGRSINKEIIDKLKRTDKGIWIEYISKRAPKKTYAQRVTDSKGKNYFIACGYYPDAGKNQTEDLVRRGYKFMKSHGLSQAVQEFNNPVSGEFRYGDLFLEVYDYEGVCKAHGTSRDLIGRNMYNMQDPDGMYYIRDIIKLAKSGAGWMSYKQSNLFRLLYVEPIDLGINKFIIVSGFYPISKMENMMLLAKSGANYLNRTSLTKALGAFVQKTGRYVNGDLDVFVFDSAGICLAMGNDYDPIWTNMIDAKDDNGRPWVRLLINSTLRQPQQVTVTLRGKAAKAYAEKVEKDGRTLIVGSHFYQ